MFYIDVTGGCTLPLQSGIPRTTRELHRLAGTRLREVVPIRWQPFRSTYTRLSRRAVAVLENRVAPRRPPRDTTWPIMLAALRDVPAWPGALPLHRTLRDADTLILTSLFPDNRLAYLEKLARAPGRRIAFFHDAIPLRDPNVPAWERACHLRALRLFAGFDLVIAVSEASRDDLLALAAANGSFNAPRPAFTKPPAEPPTLLYVSRLKEVKNHLMLLAACETLWREGRAFALALIGCEDEPGESAAIAREIRRLAREGRSITWRAQVSEAELHDAYRAASFTVFPSRHEGFGLPILESFWHGRGVICGGEGATGEVSRGPGAMHVDLTQPHELAAALRPLLDDPNACERFGRDAYSRPLRSWDDYWRDLEPHLAS
jgi:glycosyltransferase involved in cell wall biosynthesis